MLPNMVIIGAMKCGTVSLHQYLSLHPQISMSPLREVDFFVEQRNWSKGTAWYSSHFTQSTKVIGERSTSYTKYPTYSNVPARMFNILPEAKLIYMVRDPLQRIISHYVHWYARLKENRKFDEIFKDLSDNPYIYWSQYYLQLTQYLEYYSKENILVINLNDMAKHRYLTLKRVFKFLGVESSFEHSDFFKVHHRSKSMRRPTRLKLLLNNKKGFGRLERLAPWLFEVPIIRPRISDMLLRVLVDALKDDVDNFRSLTGCSFANWRI